MSINLALSLNRFGLIGRRGSSIAADYLLKEDGFKLLLEDGGNILLESADASSLYPASITLPEAMSISFQDEFEGSEVDWTKWVTYRPDGATNFTGKKRRTKNQETHEIQVSIDRNATVSDGILSLTCVKEDYNDYESITGAPKTFNWTSANLFSRNHWQKYGFFEASMKTVDGGGHWAGYWLMFDEVAITWPGQGVAGEIDATEQGGTNNQRVFTSYHHGDNYPNNTNTFTYTDVDEEPSINFHPYSVLWRRDCLKWYFNGRQLFETDEQITFTEVENILQHAVGGTAIGTIGLVDDAISGSSVQFAYCRNWQFDNTGCDFALFIDSHEMWYENGNADLSGDTPIRMLREDWNAFSKPVFNISSDGRTVTYATSVAASYDKAVFSSGLHVWDMDGRDIPSTSPAIIYVELATYDVRAGASSATVIANLKTYLADLAASDLCTSGRPYAIILGTPKPTHHASVNANTTMSAIRDDINANWGDYTAAGATDKIDWAAERSDIWGDYGVFTGSHTNTTWYANWAHLTNAGNLVMTAILKAKVEEIVAAL